MRHKFLCFISLFFLISWKAAEYDYNEEKDLKSEQMKIKAIKFQEVLAQFNPLGFSI